MYSAKSCIFLFMLLNAHFLMNPTQSSAECLRQAGDGDSQDSMRKMFFSVWFVHSDLCNHRHDFLMGWIYRYRTDKN